jgi:hypothetical protein
MRRILVAAALAAACLTSVPAVAAPARVAPGSLAPLSPNDAALSAYPIEPLASYDPQRTCTKKPRAGTVALGQYLVGAYGGSGGAINRPCKSGGTSEHKDGRAIDWTLDATSPADQTLAQRFLADITAPDATGDADALARRMGIMYVIWDDTMYAAYRGFQPERYLSSGCKKIKKCSPTLRHRDHVHISLSKAGAKALTSFYAVLKVTS